METKLDPSRVWPRSYKVQFRFVIDCPHSKHYIPKWSNAISQIMAKRLSKSEIRDLLPGIRMALPSKAKLADLYPLMMRHDAGLARCLLDASLVFDHAPAELRSHILCAFGVTPEELEAYFQDKQAVA